MNRSVEIKDNCVIKSFLDKNWYYQEKTAYELLSFTISNLDHNIKGWKIVAPDIISSDNSSMTIEMTVVPGKTLEQHMSDGIFIDWFLIGQAISLLHQSFDGGVAHKKIYGDIGVGNIMLCYDTKTIGFIDPGIHFGEWGVSSQDIFMMLWAINSARLRHGVIFFQAEYNFIKGYLIAQSKVDRDEVINLLSTGAGLKNVHLKLKARAHSKTTFRRLGISLTLYFWSRFIPWYARILAR